MRCCGGGYMYHLIVNPVAGGGRSLAVARKLEAVLTGRGLPFRTIETLRPGHATELARELAERESRARAICVGGDGTLREVAEGLCGSAVTLYIASCGTGNDFIKALGLPKDPLAAFLLQLQSEPRAIDLVRMNETLFLNVSGTGFDILVLRETERFKARFRGLFAYLLGLLSALRKFEPFDARLEIDGREVEARLTIVSVANGQYIGGGMRVSPQADPGDGLIDVTYVEAVSRLRILTLLPRFIDGSYLRLPIAHAARAASVRILSDEMIVQLDGELRCVPRAEYQILPGALRVACPR